MKFTNLQAKFRRRLPEHVHVGLGVGVVHLLEPQALGLDLSGSKRLLENKSFKKIKKKNISFYV